MSDLPRELPSNVRSYSWMHNLLTIGLIVGIAWLLVIVSVVLGSMGYVFPSSLPEDESDQA